MSKTPYQRVPCKLCNGNGRCPCRQDERGKSLFMECPSGTHRNGFCPDCNGVGTRSTYPKKLGDHPAFQKLAEKFK